MTVFQAITLGLLQGFSEFLPISSSAHLNLVPRLLGWPPQPLAFDVALHLGTVVAVLWYFREEWRRLGSAAVRVVRLRRATDIEERRVVHLVIATVPAGIAGLLLEDYADSVLRSPYVTVAMLIGLGVVLWGVDRYASMSRGLTAIRWMDALIIGLGQALALVPGVSRSGITITAGRALRLTRESAAVFSFLMSMPIIAAAAILKVPEAVRTMGLEAPLIAGVTAATLSSWLAIAVLLRYVARHSYGIFALYRIGLGCAVLAILASRG